MRLRRLLWLHGRPSPDRVSHNRQLFDLSLFRASQMLRQKWKWNRRSGLNYICIFFFCFCFIFFFCHTNHPRQFCNTKSMVHRCYRPPGSKHCEHFAFLTQQHSMENEMKFMDHPKWRINNKYGEPLSLICDEKFSLYSAVVRFLLGCQIIEFLSYLWLFGCVSVHRSLSTQRNQSMANLETFEKHTNPIYTWNTFFFIDENSENIF